MENSLFVRKPPPQMEVHFDGPNPLQGTNIAIQTCILFITTSLICLRCFVRLRIQRIWGFEDILAILQLILFYILIGLACAFIGLGGGRHMSEVPPHRQITLFYWNHVTEVFYNVVILTTKVTLLYIYLNVFAPTLYTRNWWAIATVMIANIIFYTTSLFLKVFRCLPRERIWDGSIDGNCLANISILLNATGAWNTVSDLLIVALPGLFISKLQFDKKRKIRVILYFTLAAVAYPIFSICGIVFRRLHASDSDETYWQARILLFSEAEISMGIICSCIPAVRRLILHLTEPSHTTHTLSSPAAHRKGRPHLNFQRLRQLRIDSTDTRYLDVELAEIEHTPRVRARSLTRTPYKRSRSTGAESRAETPPVRGGILMTTDIEVRYTPVEPAELPGTQTRRGSGESGVVEAQRGRFTTPLTRPSCHGRAHTAG